MHVVRQIDAEEDRARNAASQPLIAAGQGGPRQDRRVDQHLERQRDEGEIDFLQPHADRANHRRDHGRDQQGPDKGHRDRHAGTLHDQAITIGAEAEEHAVPERDHVGVTDQQIEGRGEQAERRTPDHEIEQRLAAEEQRQNRKHAKSRECNQDIEVARALRSGLDAWNAERLACPLGLQFGHATSWPNRPVGLMTRTITMNRYIRPSVNSGKPSDPKERIMPISRAPINAPRIEPMPPITVTMKDSISTENPMPGVSERTGAASAPASPASMPPSANTPPWMRPVLMPSADTMPGLCAAARFTLPSRVRASPSPRITAIASA